jgi:hypothetical protein
MCHVVLLLRGAVEQGGDLLSYGVLPVERHRDRFFRALELMPAGRNRGNGEVAAGVHDIAHEFHRMRPLLVRLPEKELRQHR